MPADLRKARELFLHAVGRLPSDEWQNYVSQACGGDTDLEQQVGYLLQVHREAGSFLELPAYGLDATIAERVPTKPGTQIGPYKILQQIGEGGMGTVFMAEQTEPVQRRVAIKIIKSGMDSHQVIARFAAEKQALALMDHVNIARVLDAGATEQGLPYFVMELVHGVPITKYCDDNHLAPRQRLELFVPVCQAIQHAHQKGIIHRDIKPSNVLITLYDGKPVPKVIDFGVAKATEQKLSDQTLFTQYGTMVGTLEYMSPEQAEMSALGIDTRSDIYSLGVLLYELLTGSTPLSRQQMKEAAFGEILRLIREEEPPKPSTRLSDSGESLASISAQRQTEPAKLSKLLRGELDWIVMKTLEKDRNRRYETANGFAADVLRYLNDEPVQACPPSAGYRFRKFARRNRVAISTALLLTIMLVICTVVSSWQAICATLARHDADAARIKESEQRTLADQRRIEADGQRAEAEEARKEAVANLRKAREAVDQMLTRVGEERLDNLPGVEPVRKGLLEDALKFYQGFLEQKSSDPELRLETAQAWRRVGNIQGHLSQYVQAKSALDECIAILEKLVAEYPSEANYRSGLADGYASQASLLIHGFNRFSEAEKATRQALVLREQLAKEFPDEPDYQSRIVDSQSNLAIALKEMGRYPEAEESCRQAISLCQKLTAQSPQEPLYHMHEASNQVCLGQLLVLTHRSSEAEHPFRRALEVYERLLSENASSQWYRNNQVQAQRELAQWLQQNGHLNDAEQLYRQSITQTEKLATDFPDVPVYLVLQGQVQQELGLLLAANHRSEEAEQAYRKAVALQEGPVAKDPTVRFWRSLLFRSQDCLADLLKADGRSLEAVKIYQGTLPMLQKLAADFPAVPEYGSELAGRYQAAVDLLVNTGQLQTAKPAMREALQLLQRLVSNFPQDRRCREQLSRRYAEWAWSLKPWHLPSEVSEAEDAYRQAVAVQEKLTEDYPEVIEFRRTLADRYNENLAPGSLGEFLFWAGRMEEAEAAARKSLEILEDLPNVSPGDFAKIAHRRRNLAFRVEKLKQLPESEKLFREAAAEFEKLAAEIPNEPHFPAFQAGSLQEIGRLLANTQPEASKRAATEALEIYDKMIARFSPDAGQMLDIHHRHMLDGAHRQRAQILNSLGRLVDAEGAYRQAISTYSKATIDSPNVPEFRQDLASFYIDFSNFLQKTNRPKEAEVEHRNSLDVRKRLVADFPNVPEYRQELGRCHNWLGRMLAGAGQFDEAEQQHREALSLYEKLALSVEPLEGQDHRRELAWSHWNLATVLQKRERLEESEAAYRQALALCEKLHADFPNDVAYSDWIGDNSFGLTVLLMASGRAEEAERLIVQLLKSGSPTAVNNMAWRLATGPDPKLRHPTRAVELAQRAVELQPQQANHWNTLGVARYRSGDWPAAIEALENSLKLGNDANSFDWFFLAMAQCQLDRKQEAKQHYDKAVAWMEKNKPLDEELKRFREEAANLLDLKEQ